MQILMFLACDEMFMTSDQQLSMWPKQCILQLDMFHCCW